MHSALAAEGCFFSQNQLFSAASKAPEVRYSTQVGRRSSLFLPPASRDLDWERSSPCGSRQTAGRAIDSSARGLAAGIRSDFLQIDVINLNLAPAYPFHRCLEFKRSGIRL